MLQKLTQQRHFGENVYTGNAPVKKRSVYQREQRSRAYPAENCCCCCWFSKSGYRNILGCWEIYVPIASMYPQCVLWTFPLLFLPSWCFAVALNFQSLATPMDLNDGRFQDNGGCGYILKPAVLMSSHGDFDPGRSRRSRGLRAKHLLLKVRSRSGK